MSTTVNLYAAGTAVGRVSAPSQHYTPGSEYVIENQNDRIFFTFAQPSSSYKYNVIEEIAFCAYKTANSVQLRLNGIKDTFNIGNVTYNNSPTVDTMHSDVINIDSSPTEYKMQSLYAFNSIWAKMITNGIRAVPYSSTYVGRSVYTASAAYSPFLKVTFSDEKVHLEPSGSPSSGYVDPREDIVLRWSNARKPASDPSIAEPTQLIAIVTWKDADDDTTHQLSTSSGTSVTIPAETWSLNKSYLWKVDVTDDGGTTTTSGWYTLTTIETSATPPTLVEPDGGTLDGSKPIVLSWVDNGRGTYKGTDISISGDDGTSWSEPVFVAEGLTTYTVPADTLTAGKKLWRARSYSPSVVAGDWSDPLPFTVIAPPADPYFEITNTPRPTISWVSDEQQAFQVQMGDYDSGLIFGRAKSFQCPVYLPDGETIVQVRVMNEYNLWSQWSGTQITIANNPGAAPQLTVDAGAEAQLSWTPGYNTAKVDGTQLTWTMGKSIQANGSLSGNTPGFGRSDYIALDGATRVRYTGPATGTSDKPYSPMVAFYNGTTFLSREIFKNFDGDVVPVPSGATQMRVVMGYAAAQDETATQTDVENFAATLYMSAADHYLVYRDGALIGETDGLSYSDRWGIGDVTYVVRAALTGDNYAQSNTVEVTLSVDQPMIAAMDGPWIVLRYTTEPVATTVINTEQTVSLMQFSGSEYPVPEIAPHRTRVYQINTAFPRGEGAVFEELLGRECFLKDQYGNAVRGVIAAIQKAQNRFYTVYSAALQQVEGDLA